MTRDHHHSIIQFYLVPAIVVAIAAATILSGCEGFATEGYACHATSSSTGDPTTIDWPETTLTTSGTTSGTTSTTDTPAESSGAETTDAEEATETTSSDDSSSTGQPALTSESESGEESTTGIWEGYDQAHCDADCDMPQYDATADACICAPYCSEDDQCEAPATCEAGRCGILCATNDDCPYNTVPTMVCGIMPVNAAVVCMWWQRQGGE